MLKELHVFSSAILIFAFFVYRFPFLRKCFAKTRRLPVLRSLVFVRIFPVQPSALGPGLRHQCWCGGWCRLAEMVCLKKFGTRQPLVVFMKKNSVGLSLSLQMSRASSWFCTSTCVHQFCKTKQTSWHASLSHSSELVQARSGAWRFAKEQKGQRPVYFVITLLILHQPDCRKVLLRGFVG